MAQAIGLAAIQQGYRVLYRKTHILLEEIAEATIDGTRKQHMELLATVPLLIIAPTEDISGQSEHRVMSTTTFLSF